MVPRGSGRSSAAFHERLGLIRASGMAIAFLGVVLIAGAPGEHQTLLPVLAALGASLAWTLANFHVKRLDGHPGMMLNAWTALLAVPQLLLGSLLFEPTEWDRLQHFDLGTVATLIYSTVFVYVAGYGLWFWLLRRQPINRAVPFTLLVPVFGLGLSVLFLDEDLTRQFIAGAVLTITGVAAIVLLPDGSNRAKF